MEKKYLHLTLQLFCEIYKYLCSASAILGEHGLIQGHQATLSSSSTGPSLQHWERLQHKFSKHLVTLILGVKRLSGC